MKKILYLIFIGVVLLFSTSCDKNESLTSYNNEDTSITSISEKEYQTENTEISDATEASVLNFNENEVIDNFIYSRNFYKYNDWIYYIAAKELRKCKPDLTEDILLAQGIYGFYFIDSTLYFTDTTIKSRPKIYKADLSSSEFQPEKIYEFKNNTFSDDVPNIKIYQDNIIFTRSGQLNVYNVNKDSEEKINEYVNYYSIIDHYVYYSLQNEDFNNYIYRYDLDTGKSEIFCQFEKNEKFTPKVHFRNRLIIIQTYINEFIYINIDDGILKNVSFDISEYERGWALFAFTDEESNMFFSVAETYEVANPTTTPFSIFRVKAGTEETELVHVNEGENIGTIAGDYVYYFDYDGNIYRKESYLKEPLN